MHKMSDEDKINEKTSMNEFGAGEIGEKSGHNHSDAANNDFDDPAKVKFINGGKDVKLDIDGKNKSYEKEFNGLSKEELMKYADDPFWVKVRWILLILFWAMWFGMLIAAVLIIIFTPKCPPRPKLAWWQKGNVYHIYPASFQDTNEDGIGDIKGIHDKLDYLKDEVNANVLMIGPMYESSVLGGLDVINHKAIAKDYGTIEELDNLRVAMHKNDIRLILDFIPNHTGKNHSWFQLSVSGQESYVDYYVWHKGKPRAGQPPDLPNNWLSVFGGPAWTWNEQRQAYYLHQFLPEQPDLNLSNPKVVEELDTILKFWLDHGVDGFRIDAAAHLFEGDLNLNEPLSGQNVNNQSYDYLEHTLTQFQDETYEILTHWRKLVDNFSGKEGRNHPRLLLADAEGTTNQTEDLYKYDGKPGVNMPLNKKLYQLKAGCNAACVRQLVHDGRDEQMYGDWNNWLVGTSDVSRITTRMGEGWSNAVNMLLLTLPGTPIIYYGDEIGMHDVNISFAETQDTMAKRQGESQYMKYTRDPERTPMQWSSGAYAGFSTVKPWLPVASDYAKRNVETQKAIGGGLAELKTLKELTKLRKEPSLLWGKFMDSTTNSNIPADDNVFIYIRKAEGFPGFLIAINFGEEPSTLKLHKPGDTVIPPSGLLKAHTRNFDLHYRQSDFNLENMDLQKAVYLEPKEGVVIELPLV